MGYQKLTLIIFTAMFVLIFSGGCQSTITCPPIPQSFELIEELAVDMGAWYFLEYDTIADNAVTKATELGIRLDKNDLINNEEDKTIERITREILGMCMEEGEAMFKTRYHSITAQLWLGYAEARVGEGDFPEANGAIVIAGANMNDAVNAVRQMDIKSEIINDGEDITIYLFEELANPDDPHELTIQNIEECLRKAIEWDMRAVEAIKDSTQ